MARSVISAAREDRLDQSMVVGLVDIDRGERIAQLDRARSQTELALPMRVQRLIERPQPEHRAEQAALARAAASRRQPFLRSCSTERHSSIALATSRRCRAANRLAPL